MRTPERYVAAVEAGRPPVGGSEVLSDDQRAFEALTLALRTPARRARGSLERPEELEGLVERVPGDAADPGPAGDRAVLTVRGPAAGQRGQRAESAPVSCTDDRDRRAATARAPTT